MSVGIVGHLIRLTGGRLELKRRAARGERRSLEQLGGEQELGELQHREMSFGL